VDNRIRDLKAELGQARDDLSSDLGELKEVVWERARSVASRLALVIGVYVAYRLVRWAITHERNEDPSRCA